jgi:hypothetical protein
VADADDIERSLALAREALLPPEGALERVHVQVTKDRWVDAGGARVPRGVTKLTTTVLVGAGFVAGYWLGLHRSDVSSASPPAATPTMSPGVSPATSPATSPAVSPAPAPTQSGDWVKGPASEPQPPAEPVPLLERSALGSPPPSSARSRAPASGATAESAEASGRALHPRRARPPTDPPLDELTLLSRAERALRAGEAALALTFLDELDRRLPRSTLLEERRAARLLADCLLAVPGAPARAQQFLHQHRGSVYSDRLQSTCALAVSDPAQPPAHGTGAGER